MCIASPHSGEKESLILLQHKSLYIKKLCKVSNDY